MGEAAGRGASPAPRLVEVAASDWLSPYFGGLVFGDQVGRVGVCIVGEGPVSNGVLHLVGTPKGLRWPLNG